MFLDISKGVKVSGHITGKSKPNGEEDEDQEATDLHVKLWFYSTFDLNFFK